MPLLAFPTTCRLLPRKLVGHTGAPLEVVAHIPPRGRISVDSIAGAKIRKSKNSSSLKRVMVVVDPATVVAVAGDPKPPLEAKVAMPPHNPSPNSDLL